MKVAIPTSINDITVEQYQKFALVDVEGKDEEFFMYKTISIFCDIDISIVSKFPLKDAKDITESIQDVLNQTVPFANRFEMDGVQYGFIPDLQAMTLGEYIDLEEGLKSAKHFHEAAAVMFRPIVKSYKNLYTIEPYSANPEYKDIMKKAPIGVVSAAIVFFYSIANELLMVTQGYSRSQKEKITTTLEKASSQRNTVGLTAYTHFLEVIRQNTDLLLS